MKSGTYPVDGGVNKYKVSTRLLVTVGALTAIGPFSIDMYLPAFKAIAQDLDTSTARVGLTLTTFFAGIALGQLLHGPLLDRFGRRGPLLVGLGVYVLACVACAMATSVGWLIVARGVMALGGCAGMVASRAVVRDVVPPHATARVFSMLMLVTGAAPMIAPSIGGVLVDVAGWRSIFLLLAAIGAAMALGSFLFLRGVRGPDPTVSLRPKDVMATWWRVLGNGHFVRHALAGGLVMAIMFAYIAGSPFVLMELYGLSGSMYGWVFGANALCFVAGSQANARLLRKRTAASMLARMVLPVAVVATAMVVVLLLFPQPPLALVCTFLLVQLFLVGFVPPNATALALVPFERDAGSASALLGALQMGVGVLASAAVSALQLSSALPMVATMAVCALAAVGVLFLGRGGRKG